MEKLSVNLRCFFALLLVSMMLLNVAPTLYADLPPGSEEMTFTSGETINFTSTTEMTFKSPTQMTFWSNVTMKFGTGLRMRFVETVPNGRLEACDWVRVTWPVGYLPPFCSWWEVIEPISGTLLGEIHVDGTTGIDRFHIDMTWPATGFPIPPGEVIAEKKIDIVEPCSYFVVHWPAHWWPNPCSWWEIIDPETGGLTGYEFHVDWTNESCEFHVDQIIPGPYVLQFPWYELVARRKITEIAPCDYFVVTEPPHWYPAPCTWWEIIDPSGLPTGLEFHVDWTNESCEFHVDEVVPDPLVIPWFPPQLNVTVEQKVVEIAPCDWYLVVDPAGFSPSPCSWWEILDPITGEPTGLEFHVDDTAAGIFHVDEVLPVSPIVVQPSLTVRVRQKINVIQECEWFRVDDPTHTPATCSWWKITHPGGIGDVEFHVDTATPDGTFHVDIAEPPTRLDPPVYELTAERKIEDIQPCDWFSVLTPTGWVPEPCSWWKITWPTEWANAVFHVDSNDGVSRFHVDEVSGIVPPPVPPPWNVTAIPTEEPPLPWYMKPPYPDYARSGMPDFDQRQGGTYLWMDPTGKWSHCGPVSIANSLWWLDSEFETNTVPPPAIIDNFPLVQAYGAWDDHDPRNVPPLVEHLAYLMDTDGNRTRLAHLGTGVLDMQAGLTHYLSWSGVNPLGDVDGDGNVTANDANIVTLALGAIPGAPNWDLRADIWPVTTAYPPVADNKIDMNDAMLVAANMGKNGTFYEHTVLAPTWDVIVEELEKCQDVVLLIAPWYYSPPWYRYDEDAHYVTVAGLNATTWELVLSDPIRDNAEAGGPGNVPVPHGHPPIEPPFITHNNASLVSHDMYRVIQDQCPGGPLTIPNFPGGVVGPPGPGWKYQIEAAVITSPYITPQVHNVAVTNLTSCYGSTVIAQNRTYNVKVTTTNEGNSPETFTLNLYWNNTHLINTTSVTLAVSETKTVQLDWNTTGYKRYNYYKLSAYAVPVPGETDVADNTFVDPRDLYITYPGDINGDKKVDIKDIAAIAKLFGINYPDPRYDPNKDITCDGKIDIKDVAIAAKNFGYVEP